MYDLIGDIHGERATLETLLTDLGYRPGDSGWRHPDRRAVFVGDFIDRGPDSIGVCELVREMVESGSALAVLGNHEINALAFHTEDSDKAGAFLRPHSHKNLKQHHRPLQELRAKGEARQDLLDWFRTLPLWLDLGELRVVHAAWHEQSMSDLAPMLDEDNRMHPDHEINFLKKDARAYAATEILLKGIECRLPSGMTFRDKDGTVRTECRIKWWLDGAGYSWKQVALGPPNLIDQLPDEEIDLDQVEVYPEDAPPVFFGHYWFTGEPRPLRPNVACLDYSVARDGGSLVAYRWDGESVLSRDNFIAVERREGRTSSGLL